MVSRATRVCPAAAVHVGPVERARWFSRARPPGPARERWERKKNTFSSLEGELQHRRVTTFCFHSACHGAQSFFCSPNSRTDRSLGRSFSASCVTREKNGNKLIASAGRREEKIRANLSRLTKQMRIDTRSVPMLSSGSGFAEDTVESMVGMLGLM